MSEGRRAKNRGRYFEQVVGRAFGVRRRGNRGTACSDLSDECPFAVEATRTTKGLGCVRRKWEQATTNARLEGKPPWLIVARPRQRLEETVSVLRTGDALEHYYAWLQAQERRAA